jgi:hypothetical protein
MSFQPVVPFGGLSGWQFLNRTLSVQKESFNAAPITARETKYFEENIGKISTAEQLVEDRTLRKVALGAFGLDDDINNNYFIKRVLSDGTIDPGSLANKMADKRYLEFSKAFGFGDSAIPSTFQSDFGAKITQAYQDRQFEIAVGAQDDNMRLAFNLDRDLADIAASSSSETTKWYTIMGNPPLREVFETAFGLPPSFVGLDLDVQLGVLEDRLEGALGSSDISQFTDPEKLEEMVSMFLVRAELNSGPSASTPGSMALTLLTQSNNRPSLLQTFRGF